MNMTIERSDHIRRRFGIAPLGMLAHGFTADPGADPNVCFIRAEGPEKEPESKPGTEPDGKCANCGTQNETSHKFCKECGKTMASRPLEEEKEPESEPPPSSEKPEHSARAGTAPDRMQAPRKMSVDATLATILGATGETPLALKTAAINLRQERDWLKGTLAGVTGQDTTAAMVGAALNIPSKIAAGKKAAADLAKVKATSDAAERWTLADRLVKASPHMRSKVLADLHDAAGNRINDPATGRSVRIRSRYASMDLGVFRGVVDDLESDGPKQVRDPFVPNQDAAREASQQAAQNHGVGGAKGVPVLVNGEPTKTQIDQASRHPSVLSMFRDSGNTAPLEALARGWVITAAQNQMPIGGPS